MGRKYGIEGPPGCNLFIYHLPSQFTEHELFHLFKHAGPIVSCRVYTDRETGESKGFGFVSYQTKTAASTAIALLNGYAIGEKRLKVQLKSKKVCKGAKAEFRGKRAHDTSLPTSHSSGGRSTDNSGAQVRP